MMDIQYTPAELDEARNAVADAGPKAGGCWGRYAEILLAENARLRVELEAALDALRAAPKPPRETWKLNREGLSRSAHSYRAWYDCQRQAALKGSEE